MVSIHKLIIKAGPEIGKAFMLDKDENIIGRELINDIIISDPEISRKHGKVFKKNSKWYIQDLKSTNGTFVRGKRITKETPLRNGDLINLGRNILLEFITEEIEEFVESKADSAKNEKKQEGTKEVKKIPQEKVTSKTKEKSPTSKKGKPVLKSESTKPPFGIKKLQNTPQWVIILIIVLLFLIVFCIIPFLIIEISNQWCNLFGTFFNQIRPGICP